MNPHSPTIAVLYQAIPAPMVNGVRKPMKRGGYADSGADIAYVLRAMGFRVVTPVAEPKTDCDLDWVFPDHAEGIATARQAGANVLWANTILFRGHPIEAVANQLPIVGQPPALVDAFDDKWITNSKLRAHHCPVATSVLLGLRGEDETVGLDRLSETTLSALGLAFPLVIKPVRGRGSQGVMKVTDLTELTRCASELLTAQTSIDGVVSSTYGEKIILEEYLDGEEITVTVMPPGTYDQGGVEVVHAGYWALPPVVRFNHQDGIAPYNGVVNVVENSRVLEPEQATANEILEILEGCIRSADIIRPLAPIRIDCRKREDGPFLLFDLNMKPNMTGAGRPGREQQDSLTCLAARAIGWSFGDLLRNMLACALARTDFKFQI